MGEECGIAEANAWAASEACHLRSGTILNEVTNPPHVSFSDEVLLSQACKRRVFYFPWHYCHSLQANRIRHDFPG